MQEVLLTVHCIPRTYSSYSWKSVPFDHVHLFHFTLPPCVKKCESESCLVMFNSATPWTVARQAPVSMKFSRQEYWSGLLCLPPSVFPTQGLNPVSCIGGRFLTVWATSGSHQTTNLWDQVFYFFFQISHIVHHFFLVLFSQNPSFPNPYVKLAWQ